MGGQVVTKARKFMVTVPTVKMWVCCAWMLCHQLAEWKKSVGRLECCGVGWMGGFLDLSFGGQQLCKFVDFLLFNKSMLRRFFFF